MEKKEHKTTEKEKREPREARISIYHTFDMETENNRRPKEKIDREKWEAASASEREEMLKRTGMNIIDETGLPPKRLSELQTVLGFGGLARGNITPEEVAFRWRDKSSREDIADRIVEEWSEEEVEELANFHPKTAAEVCAELERLAENYREKLYQLEGEAEKAKRNAAFLSEVLRIYLNRTPEGLERLKEEVLSGKRPQLTMHGVWYGLKVKDIDGEEHVFPEVHNSDGWHVIITAELAGKVVENIPDKYFIHIVDGSKPIVIQRKGKKKRAAKKTDFDEWKATEIGDETFFVPAFCVSKDAYFNAQPSALTLFDGVADYATEKGVNIDAAINEYCRLMGKAEGNIIRKADQLLRGGTGEVLYTRIEWRNFFEKLVFLGVCKFFFDQHRELFDRTRRVHRAPRTNYYVEIPISQLTNLIYQTAKATNQNKARVLQTLEDLSTRTASIEIRKKGSKRPEISLVSGLWTFGNEILTDEKTKARIYQLNLEKFFYSELERGGYIKLPANFFALLKGNKNEIAVNAFLYLNGQFSYSRMNTAAPVVEVEERKFRETVSGRLKNLRGGREESLFGKALDFLTEKNIVKNFRRFKKDGSFWLHFEEGDIYTNEPRRKKAPETAPTE